MSARLKAKNKLNHRDVELNQLKILCDKFPTTFSESVALTNVLRTKNFFLCLASSIPPAFPFPRFLSNRLGALQNSKFFSFVDSSALELI
jgi:hypothetical protein